MHVLITAGFLGRYGETDGVVTTYRNLIPRFTASGLNVDVVAYGPEDRQESVGNVRIFIHRPRVALRVDSVRRVDAAFGRTRMARALARVPYSIVQSSTPDPMGLWAHRVARRHSRPFVAIYHTALAQYVAIRARNRLGRLGARILGGWMDAWLTRYFNRADLVLAPSQCVRSEIARRLDPPVSVLSRGVDSRAFHPAKRRRDPGRARALYVGRVAPEKNVVLLAPLFGPRNDAELMIVGDGPSLAVLKQQLPGAVFAGRLEGESLARAYADADFFVFPSHTDTLGNVVLEAMASGLPVVVTDSMGPKELVQDGASGFIARNDGEFAQAVDVLATDAGRRQAMGLAARRYAETRSWQAIFDQLLHYYRALLADVPAATEHPGVAPRRCLAARDASRGRFLQ